jgi:hypothetical protein
MDISCKFDKKIVIFGAIITHNTLFSVLINSITSCYTKHFLLYKKNIIAL